MYDLSIIVPTIRTHLLKDLYQSFCDSCNTHTFEVIFVGPFDIPESLMEKEKRLAFLQGLLSGLVLGCLFWLA